MRTEGHCKGLVRGVEPRLGRPGVKEGGTANVTSAYFTASVTLRWLQLTVGCNNWLCDGSQWKGREVHSNKKTILLELP
jgi:hypothetical protein